MDRRNHVDPDHPVAREPDPDSAEMMWDEDKLRELAEFSRNAARSEMDYWKRTEQLWDEIMNQVVYGVKA